MAMEVITMYRIIQCESKSCSNFVKLINHEFPYKACGACGAKRYCSRECQKADWKTHKNNECAELKEAYDNLLQLSKLVNIDHSKCKKPCFHEVHPELGADLVSLWDESLVAAKNNTAIMTLINNDIKSTSSVVRVGALWTVHID